MRCNTKFLITFLSLLCLGVIFLSLYVHPAVAQREARVLEMQPTTLLDQEASNGTRVLLKKINLLEEEIALKEKEVLISQSKIRELGTSLSAQERSMIPSFQKEHATTIDFRQDDDSMNTNILARPRIKNDFRVGDRVIALRGSADHWMISGAGVIVDDGAKREGQLPLMRITDFGPGVRPEDRILIVNRDSSPYSASRFKVGKE